MWDFYVVITKINFLMIQYYNWFFKSNNIFLKKGNNIY